jgi:hypothetical protein
VQCWVSSVILLFTRKKGYWITRFGEIGFLSARFCWELWRGHGCRYQCRRPWLWLLYTRFLLEAWEMFYQGPTVAPKCSCIENGGITLLRWELVLIFFCLFWLRIPLFITFKDDYPINEFPPRSHVASSSWEWGGGGGYLTHVVGSWGFSRPFVWRLYELALVCAIEMGWITGFLMGVRMDELGLGDSGPFIISPVTGIN